MKGRAGLIGWVLAAVLVTQGAMAQAPPEQAARDLVRRDTIENTHSGAPSGARLIVKADAAKMAFLWRTFGFSRVSVPAAE
jgi:hypothetical protein